jgi:2-dehydro-3-deoxyphosphogalactonate aldolase
MNLTDWLERCPLIAILRGINPHEVEAVFNVLFAAGISIAEIPMNSPHTLESISIATRSFGEHMLIGAGTVTRISQVDEVAKAGGRLIVMPHADASIVEATKTAGLIAIPGFSTATEAFAMLHAGADAIKLFPAEVSGPFTLKALRSVLPGDAMIIPVGGVDVNSIPAWKAAGAAGYGVGSALYRPAESSFSLNENIQALLQALE